LPVTASLLAHSKPLPLTAGQADAAVCGPLPAYPVYILIRCGCGDCTSCRTGHFAFPAAVANRSFSPLIISKDATHPCGLARGIFVRLARKLDLKLEDRPGPYSVVAWWEAEDYLFVARHARPVDTMTIFVIGTRASIAAYITNRNMVFEVASTIRR
jgi:hypothetical protein